MRKRPDLFLGLAIGALLYLFQGSRHPDLLIAGCGGLAVAAVIQSNRDR